MTRRIVVDASVTLAWLFREDGGPDLIGPSFAKIRLVAPSLWQLEVTNAILVHERRKKVTPRQGLQAVGLIDDLGVELVPDPQTRTAGELARLSRPYQLTAYDAVYLALAMHLKISLATRDANLKRAAARSGVTVSQF